MVPHTADLIIEAWAQSRIGCLEEAAAALVGSFAELTGATATGSVPVALEGSDEAELLVTLLEEIIYAIEVLERVPVRAMLAETEDHRVVGSLEVVPAGEVQTQGALPKGVSYADLSFEREGDTWRCRATIDV